jgi:hypothetical protein
MPCTTASGLPDEMQRNDGGNYPTLKEHSEVGGAQRIPPKCYCYDKPGERGKSSTQTYSAELFEHRINNA